MTKKHLSVLLVLCLIMSTVGALQMPVLASTSSALTIDDITGEICYEQDFDDKTIGTSYSSLGDGYIGTDRNSGATYTVYYETVSFPTASNSNNIAFGMRSGGKLAMHVTAEEKDEIDAANTFVQISAATKAAVKQYSFLQSDGSYMHYLIGYRTNDPGRRKWYFPCDENGTITKSSTGTATVDGVSVPLYNLGDSYSFFNTETGEPMAPTANSTVDFPAPENLKRSDNWIIGRYAASMNFAFPSNGDLYNADALCYNIGDIELRFGQSSCSYGAAFSVIGADDATVSTGGSSTFIGKTADTESYVAAVDKDANLNAYTTIQDNVWHNILTDMDFDNGTFKVYYDGYPIYFPVKSGSTVVGYSSEIVIPGHAQGASFPKIGLTAQRYQSYYGHLPAIDDIVMKYDTDTIETKLTWTTISNGQSQAAVISNLNLVDSITVKGTDYPVTWSSSNPNVISNKGVVVRSDENTSAVLTATVGGKTIEFSVGVAGKSGKKQVFLAGDSHMCYYEDSWYPQKGWGMYIDDYFTNTDFYNIADGGESTKSFYEGAGFFNDGILDKLSQGDYVLISFGTNDSNTGYSTAVTLDEYATYLQTYIDDIKGKNAVPVFITSPVSGGGVSTASTGINAYVDKMKEVASQNEIACIDLRAKHVSYIDEIRAYAGETGTSIPELVMDEMYTYQIDENYGIDYTTHPSGALSDDGTDIYHFSERGAQVLARWVATEIYKSDNADLQVLAESMKADMVKPTIYTAGDSLMFNWGKWPNYKGYMGWGECIGKYFDGAKVDNRALSGMSTNTFYNDADLFPAYRYNMYDDDYLIISLGYNDSGYVTNLDRYGENSAADAEVKTDTYNGIVKGANITTYKANLKLFVNAAKERGVTPILVTFPNDSSVYNNKRTYVQTLRDVASEEDVPLIDLRNKHLEYITEYYGQTISEGTSLSGIVQNVLDEMHSTQAGIEALGFTDVTLYDGTHFNLKGAQTLGNWFIELLMESTDADLAVLQSLVDEDAIPSETLAKNNLKITGVEFTEEPGTNGRTGAAIKATLPEGRLTRMKWVFATDDARYYSSTIVPESLGVTVSGDVKFGIVFNNGTVDADGNLNGDKKINSVDAIFMIDGMEFFTNLLDKAAKN